MDARRTLLLVPCLALAGCSIGADDEGSPLGPATASATSVELEGVVLDLVRTDLGDAHRLDATVRNTGLRVFYYLWVPQCGLEPWADGMVGPGGTAVQPREPEAHCLPCGWDALSPGESLSTSFDWDERIWEDELPGMRDAPPGTYRWSVTFRAEPREDSVCGGDRSVSASLLVKAD